MGYGFASLTALAAYSSMTTEPVLYPESSGEATRLSVPSQTLLHRRPSLKTGLSNANNDSGATNAPRDLAAVPQQQQQAQQDVTAERAPANATGPAILHAIWYTNGNRSRQMSDMSQCALQRLVQYNPDMPVWLWTDNPQLQAAEGLVLKSLNKTELVDGTPLVGWSPTDQPTDQPDDSECFTDQNWANALRLAILYHYGGMYMDLDVVSVAPIPALGAALTCEIDDQGGKVGWCHKWNNEVMSFPSQKDQCLEHIMSEFRSSFNNCKWGYNGPKCLTRVMRKHPEECSHVASLGTRVFSPLDPSEVESMTTELPPQLNASGVPQAVFLHKQLDTNRTYAVHTFNHICLEECQETFLHTYCPEMTAGIYAMQQWRDEVMCGEYRAIDRAKWIVENQGKVMREAKLQVIREFPEVFDGRESRRRTKG